jgi:multiple sugar transport system substrate-binding protein
MDVVWTAEFAAKGIVEAMPPDTSTDGMLKAAVDSATYFNKLYGLPYTSDGGLLYYRKDLLDKYGLKPPTTFDEMKAACDKITAGEKDSKLGCFAGQYNKYEGLTVNFDEAVHGAGGVIVGDDGKPNVATPEATMGLQTLTDWFKDLARRKWTNRLPARRADLPPQLGIRVQPRSQRQGFRDQGQVRCGGAAWHHRSWCF